MIEKCSISGLIDEEYLKKFDCGENSVNEFLTGCSKKYASEDLRETTLFYDGESGGWTYFDELAHRMANALQGVELTDDEIMTTIKRFVGYVKENNIE